jgi:hypothetical protein
MPACSGIGGMPEQADSRFGALMALIASHLSNAPLRANTPNGVTGYHQATLLKVGRKARVPQFVVTWESESGG